MGEDCGTWLPQCHIDWQSINLNSFNSSISMRKPDTDVVFMNSYLDMGLGNGAGPFSGPSCIRNFNLSQSNFPHAWFYGLPRFRQAFMPTSNFTNLEKLASETEKNVEGVSLNGHQRKFLVVDQSGDKMTFMFSSGFRNPIQCLTSWSPKLECANMFGNSPLGEGSTKEIGASSKNEFNMYQRADVHSEMHEDTAEINALLYSGDDCCSVEDEVISTGHSPSTMTKDYDKHELAGGSTDEVPSSLSETKKRKRLDVVDYDTQLMDTASSSNCNRCVEYESDAEGRCEGGNDKMSVETGPFLSSKRMKKERVREILNVLQGILPGGKERDPVMLLDDAIDCLKSLKNKWVGKLEIILQKVPVKVSEFKLEAWKSAKT